MSSNKTADLPQQDRALVTAGEWFAGGQRIPYDPETARVLTEKQAAATPGALRVFERVAAAGQDKDSVWLTPYEHRQIQATRQRVPGADVLTFPGGHLTTSEHPDLLAAAIRDVAARRGVGTPATAHR